MSLRAWIDTALLVLIAITNSGRMWYAHHDHRHTQARKVR